MKQARILKNKICSILIVLSLILAVGGLSNLCAEDKIIAVVNSEVITQKDLDDFFNFTKLQLVQELKGDNLDERTQSLKQNLLDKLIIDKLILQEAKNKGISINEDRIEARIDEIREMYPSDKDFQEDLLKQGITLFDLREKISEQMLMRSIIEIEVESSISVTPREITDFYNENINKFESEEARKLEVITLENEELAVNLSIELRRGQHPEVLAKRYSLTLDNLEVSKSELSLGVGEEVFNLQVGGVSNPVEIEGKFYIFILKEIVPSRKLKLTEVQERIRMFLFDLKMQKELVRWIDGLKEKAYIKLFS